jgi:hypothetical protein
MQVNEPSAGGGVFAPERVSRERKSRVALKCHCGVRLDVIALFGDTWMFSSGTSDGSRGPWSRRDQMRGRMRNVADRRADPRGEAINYRCGGCRAHYSIRPERLVAAAQRRSAAGGRELEAGVDI